MICVDRSSTAHGSGNRPPLGCYDATAFIGEGGMGEVYKATDTRLDRTVAIKMLPDGRVTSPRI